MPARLREGFSLPAQRRFAPFPLTLYSPSAYFGMAICLLWINRLLLMSCKQRHLWVAPKSSSTCSAVIYKVFRSHLTPVKWLGNGRKVTHLRMEGTSGTTQRDVRNKTRVAAGVWRSLHDRREGVQGNHGWQYGILVVSFCRRLCFGTELAIVSVKAARQSENKQHYITIKNRN